MFATHYTGTPGIYFFSLDASNLLAVAVARTFYHLPYHWAEMRLEQRTEREFAFYSRRRFARASGGLQGALSRAGTDAQAGGDASGTLEYFLMERSCLFTRNRDWAADRERICTMFRGRWKKRRRRLSRTTWRGDRDRTAGH